ncbi:hypothetical protein ASPWEDRAFT_737094 [Aspergillus wentii DTO 134E9]|uniref:Methyltransferase domain-containing protein n=1 Tax=Aspergillus wentii DTO 134E9 TaxID=1073089 RepID=A0A1L9RN34_ASPWE|nr:uncharacterized protein ASPWEDRAFT_737094 [Aspergillus wentii DTO 134E9]OJJ36324.1 hypothetical protein ASPWEDRAFT_737094 [Aspergillus wentii DTO 134E9]
MWGEAYEDHVARIEAVQYLESKISCFGGVPSASLLQTKDDFYTAARKKGSPIVPSNDLSRFPLFVKPVHSYASHGIDDSSLCFNEEELKSKIAALDASLAPHRDRRPYSVKSTRLGELSIPSDILVTEYIRGVDYFVVVCQIGDTVFPLCPEKWRLPPSTHGKLDVFLTPQMKYHAETDVELLKQDNDPILYDALQSTALQAWKTSNTGAYWSHVDMRVRANGEIVALQVNPMAGIFTPPGIHPVHDPSVTKHFPGGHRSLINCALAVQRIKSSRLSREIQNTHDQISASYDRFSDLYDSKASSQTRTVPIIEEYISMFGFDGTVLDLGCGTGAFGRILHQHHPDHPKLPGIELSPQMAARATSSGAYGTIFEGSIQQHVSSIGRIDHVVSWYALQFLDEVDLNFALTTCFINATQSITFSIDEIPDKYNEDIKEAGDAHMVQFNHVAAVERFGVPHGWRLAHRRRQFAWKSAHTKYDVYSTVFRYERV